MRVCVVYKYIVESIKYSKYTINYNDKKWSKKKNNNDNAWKNI